MKTKLTLLIAIAATLLASTSAIQAQHQASYNKDTTIKMTKHQDSCNKDTTTKMTRHQYNYKINTENKGYTDKNATSSFLKRHNYQLNITTKDTLLVLKTRNSENVYTGKNAIRKVNQLESFRKWGWAGGKYIGINIMYNGLVSGLGSMNLPSNAQYMTQTTKSIGVDLNLIDGVLFSSGCFGIVSGLGLEINNFRFANNISLTRDKDGYTIPDNSYTERGINLSKSKLTTTYLNVPLLFQFQIGRTPYKKESDCWISVGIVGGIKLQSYTKVMYSHEGRDVKKKEFNNQNIANFHLGFQASIGFYSGFNVTAKYYPQSIFRSDFGPHVEQVSIGIGYVF